MKRLIVIILALMFLTGCTGKANNGASQNPYTQIDQDTAKEMMTRNDGHVIVDVRRQDEYDEGHIPGAILIPNESIGSDPPEADPMFDGFTDFYYTYDASTYPPYYQRYRFYAEGGWLFW